MKTQKEVYLEFQELMETYEIPVVVVKERPLFQQKDKDTPSIFNAAFEEQLKNIDLS